MKCKIIIILLILPMMISGCNNKDKDTEIKTLDKAPDSLVEIKEGISDILDNVGKIERINLDIDYEDDTKEDHEEESTGKELDQSQFEQNEEDKEEENQGDNESEPKGDEANEENTDNKKGEKVNETWKEIDKSLEEVYLKLSGYESQGLEKGASKDRVTQLQQGINKFAQSIEGRDIVSVYDYGGQSLLNLKPFYDLYKDDYRGEICDIESSVYQYYIRAISDDIEGAREQVKSKEETINRIRILIDDDKERNKKLDKVSSSLENIGISLDEGSKRVYILEKDTLIKNLKSLE